MGGMVDGVRSQGRRIAPKKVSTRLAADRVVGAQDRRLVQPETLNEEGRLRDDTPAVRAGAGDARARALRVRRRARRREGAAARRGAAEVGGGLRAQRRQQRRHLGRIGGVDGGEREGRAAGAARMELHRHAPPRRCATVRSCWSGRQGNISAAPLPSGRASRQSKAGEQAERERRRRRAPRRRPGRPGGARVSASADYPRLADNRRHDRRERLTARADGARRRARPRPVARPRRTVVHADARRPRRRRDQGRAPGARRRTRRRRHPRLGPALPARRATAPTPPRPPTTSAPTATSAR